MRRPPPPYRDRSPAGPAGLPPCGGTRRRSGTGLPCMPSAGIWPGGCSRARSTGQGRQAAELRQVSGGRGSAAAMLQTWAGPAQPGSAAASAPKAGPDRGHPYAAREAFSRARGKRPTVHCGRQQFPARSEEGPHVHRQASAAQPRRQQPYPGRHQRQTKPVAL